MRVLQEAGAIYSVCVCLFMWYNVCVCVCVRAHAHACVSARACACLCVRVRVNLHDGVWVRDSQTHMHMGGRCARTLLCANSKPGRLGQRCARQNSFTVHIKHSALMCSFTVHMNHSAHETILAYHARHAGKRVVAAIVHPLQHVR